VRLTHRDSSWRSISSSRLSDDFSFTRFAAE
jgi:hypothetical protein